jgi:uncharacterized protein (TIGR02444 family)
MKGMRMAGAETDRFWAFSVALWGDPSLRAAALRLQDEAGLDVNLAFFCLYLGEVLGRGVDAAALDAASRAIRPWNQSVVQPLRTLRRHLAEAGEPAVRSAVGAAELEAERVAQARLIAAVGESPGAPRAGAAAANLRLYAGSAGDALWQAYVSASPQRRTVPESKPKRSSIRPSV